MYLLGQFSLIQKLNFHYQDVLHLQSVSQEWIKDGKRRRNIILICSSSCNQARFHKYWPLRDHTDLNCAPLILFNIFFVVNKIIKFLCSMYLFTNNYGKPERDPWNNGVDRLFIIDSASFFLYEVHQYQLSLSFNIFSDVNSLNTI